ncbi:hypothetical protein ALC56_14048 [Trachymyrmex septentrionalis]|uniref:Uncharacterized protein n=1 Tax=Trachymyrmex septentrionalis TaxID=34720 RepID=A0A151JT48_9HYME|nr:hypothetical protein ALC56_14048 [Trachymyrmex septentrionalis]
MSTHRQSSESQWSKSMLFTPAASHNKDITYIVQTGTSKNKVKKYGVRKNKSAKVYHIVCTLKDHGTISSNVTYMIACSCKM